MRVFVVGGTGRLGRQVVARLVQQGDQVTVLVRRPEAQAEFARLGVGTALGDLKDARSIAQALGRDHEALVTTAYGYGRRSPGDSLSSVDDIGNRDLIAAARDAGVRRFVFTSILTADKATSVPHFHQKARTEAVLEQSGLDWISLRPGGFIDTLLDFSARGIERGRLSVPTDLDVPASTIHSFDVAACLAKAVHLREASCERIDLGMDRPTSIREIAQVLTTILGRPVTAQRPPGVAMALMKTVAALDGRLSDNLKAMEYVASGRYVADVTRQTQLFGPPLTLEASLRRWAADRGRSR
jgi:uncharacterized protein YbjT (DUF2867 family)